MKKRVWLCRVLLSLCLALVLGAGTAADGFFDCERTLSARQASALKELQENAGDYSEETLVLEGTTPARAEKLAERLGASLRITKDGTYAALTLPQGQSVSEVFSARENRDILSEFSLDTVHETDEAVVEPITQWPFYAGGDTLYREQVNLKYLGLGNTWDITRGKFEDGTKVKVAVIDSGIDINHPEFFDAEGKRIVSEQSYDANTGVTVAKGGWDVINDTMGHGTAVAGVIAAQMNSIGIVGIAPDVELLIIKVDDEDGVFCLSDVSFCIDYAVENGAHVITTSFYRTGSRTQAALQRATDKGIPVIFAGGNYSTNGKQWGNSLAIRIGALAKNSWELAAYSNYGGSTDLVTTGSVYTTSIGGKYGWRGGTSFAAPTVAAAVALYISVYGVTPYEEIRARLLDTCVDLGEEGNDIYFNHGALNIENFLNLDTVSVTFDYRAGLKAQDTSFLKRGERFTKTIPVPEAQNGLQFEGWYLDERLTQPVDFETYCFEEDTTLYARWLGTSSGDFDYYEYARGFVKLLAYRGDSNVLVIPEELDGKYVNAIAPFAFAGNKTLEEISLSQNIHTIGADAFSECENLRIVYIHSATVLEQITETDSPGGLCRYASAVLADATLDFDETQIKRLYLHQDTVEWGGVSYKKYSDHESEWTQGEVLVVRIPCEQDGVSKLICNKCGGTSELLFPKHADSEWVIGTPAKCTEKGTNELKCVDCHTVFESRETPATGHSYGEGVTVSPTCEERGYFLRSCKSCGYENKGNYVKANGHDKGEWTCTLVATKTEAGEEQISCLACEKVVETRVIAPFVHLLQFESDVATLTGDCNLTSYEAIAACVTYYGTLNEEERELAKNDYERLCEVIARYNESAIARNEALAEDTQSATYTVASVYRAPGGVWLSPCEKIKEGEITV